MPSYCILNSLTPQGPINNQPPLQRTFDLEGFTVVIWGEEPLQYEDLKAAHRSGRRGNYPLRLMQPKVKINQFPVTPTCVMCIEPQK